jgi:hypothetical protein
MQAAMRMAVRMAAGRLREPAHPMRAEETR